jgi:hypothetical protein
VLLAGSQSFIIGGFSPLLQVRGLAAANGVSGFIWTAARAKDPEGRREAAEEFSLLA